MSHPLDDKRPPIASDMRPRRKIHGNVALVVRGGHAQIKDVVVISGHRSREAAGKAASVVNASKPWSATAWDRAYVVWADEFMDAGGRYSGGGK